MYDDLESIANLRFGEAVERISREGKVILSAKVADLTGRGLSNSGYMVKAKLDSDHQSCEQICHALYDIWLQLILQRNRGKLTRDDLNFIIAKVEACVQARAANIGQRVTIFGTPMPSGTLTEAQARMQSVASSIRRELEIRLREQEAFRGDVSLDTSFLAFLRAFGGSWLSRMSGPLTVPFAIATLFISGHYRLLFGVLAVASGVISAYEVWRIERKHAAG